MKGRNHVGWPGFGHQCALHDWHVESHPKRDPRAGHLSVSAISRLTELLQYGVIAANEGFFLDPRPAFELKFTLHRSREVKGAFHVNQSSCKVIVGEFRAAAGRVLSHSTQHIGSAPNIKRTVGRLEDVNEYASRANRRWLNSWQNRHFYPRTLTCRKPFDKLRAFDATPATEWLAMSKARASRGPRRMAARSGWKCELS